MKPGLVILGVLASSTVAAEPLPLVVRTSEPAPKVMASAAACNQAIADPATDGALALVHSSLVVGGARIRTLHECGAMDATAYLEVSRGSSSFVSWGGTIAYRGANMTEAPLHIRFLDEGLRGGTLAGRPIVIHHVDTLHRTICRDPGCGQESGHSEQQLTICTLPATGDPACGSIAYECGAQGCRYAIAGTQLTVQTAKGPRRYELSVL